MTDLDIFAFKEGHKKAYYECGFTWKSDSARMGVPESWNSLYPDMTRGKRLIGDCEDVALAVVDHCVYMGVDPEIVGIARIKTKNSDAKFFDHAVAVLLTSKGAVELVSDCNTPERVLRKISGKPYDFISAEALAKGDKPKVFAI